MAGIRLAAEETDHTQPTRGAGDIISDDDRSVAADSWSIKSEYGSTLDDDQRHADGAEALSNAAHFRTASDYSSDKEDEGDEEGVGSMLGLQSYWDSAYADELTNFHDHGDAGEICFGADVMETVVSWTKNLCLDISYGRLPDQVEDSKSDSIEQDDNQLSTWSVFDIGTGNGILLHELAKKGFSDLTGTDYSEGAIKLARSIADRDGFSSINFLVDDILETKLDRQFKLVMDKGTLDAIGLHPDGPVKRIMYWDSVYKLVASGGLLVITSCNNTKDELIQEAENFNNRRKALSQESETSFQEVKNSPFQYISHVRAYPTFMFGGSAGSRVATVAFLRN